MAREVGKTALALGAAMLLAAAAAAACGPTGTAARDASPHDGTFGLDASPGLDAMVSGDASAAPDAGPGCDESPEARTGTTVYHWDAQGDDSTDPIDVGTVITVEVEIDVTTPPTGNVGFVQLALANLVADVGSFTYDDVPVQLAQPFEGRVPVTLSPPGRHVLVFEATVDSLALLVEVDAALGYGPAGACPVERSHSLAVIQVIGGVVKGETCYDLDQARSVQVAPAVPLQSTAEYENQNGTFDLVDIDGLVVGGPACPGPGVLVHQVRKCFTRQADTQVTLSGHAYGGDPWIVDDVLLVEVLDAQEHVLTALTTFQVGDMAGGCCPSPPCTSSLAYASGGPSASIQNIVQGGGNNGEIAAGVMDITPYLPAGPGPFFLRFTALDQGVEGGLSRVFVNVD